MDEKVKKEKEEAELKVKKEKDEAEKKAKDEKQKKEKEEVKIHNWSSFSKQNIHFRLKRRLKRKN
jgi:hypothetical protein